MICTAKIIRYDGDTLLIKPTVSIDREMLRKQVDSIEIRLTDGREISADQRKKIFAIVRDIAIWSGHEPEYIRQFLTFEYCLSKGVEPFSLAACDITTAKEYINYLIEFCFTHSVPTRQPLLNRTDDIEKYLYSCVEYRRCAICNDKADIHHVTAVGMGRNRDAIIHEGMEVIALCRKHHTEVHTKGKDFFEVYHVKGIKLDSYLCKKLRLGESDAMRQKLF